MTDNREPEPNRRSPHPMPMALAFLEFDLVRELRQSHEEPTWAKGQNAKTLVKYDDFRIVLMTLRPARTLAATKHPAPLAST